MTEEQNPNKYDYCIVEDEKIPELYATENVPVQKKMIYRRYLMKERGFYWLIAEFDKKESLAFGYANLNDDQMAEWGYISVKELINNGVHVDKEWKPCSYRKAIERIRNERSELLRLLH